jgi:hypothetical protein
MVPVVADGSAAGAKAGKAEATEILVLLVPLGGMTGPAEVLVFSATAKNPEELDVVRKIMTKVEKQ